MNKREYRKISSNQTLQNNNGVRPQNGCGRQPHHDYEYFQLYDPDDSDIEDEADPDVRSLLINKITTYVSFPQPQNNRCNYFIFWCITHLYKDYWS